MDIRDRLFILLILIVIHILLLSYYDEYLLVRHPFFQFNIRKAKVDGFGKCKTFYHARERTLEFYTKISYYEQGQEYRTKIVRGMDDEIGKEIIVAVEKEGKLAVRYEKCNWYNERWTKGGVVRMRNCVDLYIFTHIMLICSRIIGVKAIREIYIAYILFAVIHYLFLPQMVSMRNYIWEKDWESWTTKEIERIERERIEKNSKGEN